MYIFNFKNLILGLCCDQRWLIENDGEILCLSAYGQNSENDETKYKSQYIKQVLNYLKAIFKNNN